MYFVVRPSNDPTYSGYSPLWQLGYQYLYLCHEDHSPPNLYGKVENLHTNYSHKPLNEKHQKNKHQKIYQMWVSHPKIIAGNRT